MPAVKERERPENQVSGPDDIEAMLARAKAPAMEALRLHPFYKGKMQTIPKCPVHDISDFAIWYTPGVAAPCKAIRSDPDAVYEHTNKGNSVAIVTDGTRVLGLGDIGPQAGLPVMEGKALLFKYLGGIDATPICLGTKDPDELIHAVLWLQPSFGGINLEDISQPKCFRVLDTLRERAEIPVWHDDQQGTATVILAALVNALKVVDKRIDEARVVFVGTGAAGVACMRLAFRAGVDPQKAIAVDIGGILHPGRTDFARRKAEFVNQWQLCNITNGEGRTGGVKEALAGADVCIAFSASGPGVLLPEWIEAMADDAIVFACANPIPEIWPWEARKAGVRVFATGRCDFPNQVNNSLGFPGIFRGALDVRASAISDEMCIAAAHAMAEHALERGLDEEHILPTMDDWEIFPREAVAVAMKAQEQGIARLTFTEDELRRNATDIIAQARDLTDWMMRKGFIPEAPEV